MANFIKEMFEDNPVMAGLLILSISGTLFFCLDYILSKSEIHSSQIIDKHYKAEHSNSGIGYGYASNGKLGAIVTSNYENEKFIIIVKTEKEILSVESSAFLYYDKSIGQKLQYKIDKGYFTSLVWSIKTLK